MPSREDLEKRRAVDPIPGFEGTEIDVEYYLAKEYDDVSEANREIPGVMETINELRQFWQEERDAVKVQITEAEAKAYFALKADNGAELVASYRVKVTEEAVKMAVALDPEVRQLNKRLASISAKVNRLSGTIVSIQSKVDLLRSSEATRRKVFVETDPGTPRE